MGKLQSKSIGVAIAFLLAASSVVFGAQAPAKKIESKRVFLQGKTISEGKTLLAAAQGALSQLAEKRGVSPDDFILQRSTELGSGGRTVFVFRQVLDGLPVQNGVARILVRHGSPNIAIFASADLASAPAEGFQPDQISGTQARELVRSKPQYAHLSSWSSSEKVVFYDNDLDRPVRAWKMQGIGSSASRQEAYTFFVDAASGTLLKTRNEIVHGDVQGHVQCQATPGTLPDVDYNPAQLMDLAGVKVQINGAEIAYTDSLGNYLFPFAGESPVTLQTSLVGKWAKVLNAEGDELSLQQIVTPPMQGNFFYNQTPQPFDTAQLNAFIHVTKTHDFYKQYQPDFSSIDLPIVCNVNYDDKCNAFFNGSSLSLYFFHAEDACVNMAYSTVISHEYGHFIVNRLGLEQEAFGEGFADSVAILVHDTPLNGEDYAGPGTFVRDLSTNVTYPCNSSLIHFCGMVLAGIWWDIKTNIQQTHGEELGLEITRQLFTDWSQITAGGENGYSADLGTIGEILAADDDDGNLLNGTPHQQEICGALFFHNLPCFDCNNNGIIDQAEIETGLSADCNNNNVPDECEIALGWSQDCNGNGILDICEIADLSATDCNANGFPDSCDIQSGLSQDCNGNGILDECEPIDFDYKGTQTFGGTQTDMLQAVAIDRQGNIFVTGDFRGTVDFDPSSGVDNHTSLGQNDVFITKLNANGSYGWTHTFGGTLTDQGSGIAVDHDGDVLVVGKFSGSVDFNPTDVVEIHEANTTGGSSFLVKFTSDGDYLWTQTLAATSSSQTKAIYIDSSGNTYLAGSFGGTLDFDPGSAVDNHTSSALYDCFITKLNANGSYGWTQTFGGPLNEFITGMATDSGQNIILSGYFISPVIDLDPTSGEDNHVNTGSFTWDFFVMKLLPDGSYGWGHSWGAPSSSAGSVLEPGIAIDKMGQIFVAGGFSGTVDFDPGDGTDNRTSLGLKNIFMIKLNQDGSYAGTKIMGGNASASAYATRIVTDTEGNLLIAGAFKGTIDFDPNSGIDNHTSLGQNDVFLTKLNQDDSYGWTKTIGAGSADQAERLAINHKNELALAGTYKNTVDFNPSDNLVENHTSSGLSDIFVQRIQLPQPAQYYADCNGNGSFDGCDIEQNYSQDQNGNGIPDECEYVNLVDANPPMSNPYIESQQPFRDVLQMGKSGVLTQGIGGRTTPNEGPIVYKNIKVSFSGTPVLSPSPNNIQIHCTGGICPKVISVSGSGAGPFTINLDRPIPVGERTTLTFVGTPAEQKLQYESLPGDVDMNGVVDEQDIAALKLAIEDESANSAQNLARYDINRSGKVNSDDLRRLIALVHGENTGENTRPR